MGGLFGRRRPREEVEGCQRCRNAFSNNFRGIMATLLGIIFLAVWVNHRKRDKSVLAVMGTMESCMLFAPVPAGACGLIPIFLFPMFGILESSNCCSGLVNENIIFFFVGGWLLMLLNNCGMDKRLICSFLACGKEDAFTPQKLLCKSCFAAFFASALSNRELATQVIMKYVISALQPLQTVKGEANYLAVKEIICNAVAISSTIGSLCIMHSAVTTIQMRALFCDADHGMTENLDVFNFLNYSVFAVPMALVMFLFNLLFQSIMMFQFGEDKDVSKYSQNLLRKTFLKNQKDLGPTSWHEKLSTAFLVLLLICYFTRWSKWLNMGWGSFRKYTISPELCGLKDATTASIFVIVLHFLPKSLNFMKIFSASKQREKPVMKVESGILFWKFIDKNTDYSLFIAFGAGIVVFRAILMSQLFVTINDHIGEKITELPWNAGILIVVLSAVISANLMSCVGAQATIMPVFLVMAMTGQQKWPVRVYLVALAVGMGSALGFCFPSRNSPLQYVRTIGKVGCKKQVWYSLLPVIVCTVVLWVFLCFYAPVLWDPNDEGIILQIRPLPPSIAAQFATPPPAEADAPEAGD